MPPEKNTLAREEEFHDQWAESIDLDSLLVRESFECCTAPESRTIRQWLGEVQGKTLLDLGSGAGEAAVYFAGLGAQVTATDLSSGMLDVVQRLAQRHGVSVKVQICPADDLAFPDDSFDVVHGANLLHHVDIDRTLREVRRVLKPGGTAVFWDPLDHNPLIKIYRRLAQGVRTPDEHPLRFSELALFRRHFSQVQFECFWFLTLWIFLRFFLIERVNPNEERYWKKVITDHQRLAPTYLFLERLDQRLLGAFPFLKRYCWNIAVCCVK